MTLFRPAFLRLPGLIICLSILLIWSSWLHAQRPGMGPAGVSTLKVAEIEYSSRKTFVGTLFPKRTTVVGSAVDGRVIQVFVDAGDTVSAEPGLETDEETIKPAFRGQPLVALRTGTLDIEIKAAQIQAELARKTYEELELNIPADTKVAAAELEQARSQLTLAKKDFEMLEGLRNGSGAVSEIELQRSRAQFLAATEMVSSAELKLAKLKSTRDVRLAQAELAMEATQQELVRLQDLRNKYTIRAPFEGVVVSKLTEVGAWVTRGSDVAQIVQLDPIEIVLNVPQEFMGKLYESTEQDVNVRFDGIDELFQGQIDRIVPQLDLRSRTIPVRVRLQNPKSEKGAYRLNPGMQGMASFAIGNPTRMTVVKKDALVLDQGRTYIYQVQEREGESVARKVSVQTGISTGQWVQVIGDIRAGDEIVVLGNERLRPGQALKVLSQSEAKPDLQDGS